MEVFFTMPIDQQNAKSASGLRLHILTYPEVLAQSIALIAPTMTAALLIPLAFAGAFHIVGSVCVFAIGRLGLIPSQFDRSGLGKFAPDSFVYQQDIANLSDKLSRDGPGAWRWWQLEPRVCRRYSLGRTVSESKDRSG